MDLALDPPGFARNHAHGRRSAWSDAPVRRSVLHGFCLPIARDEECGAVRLTLRYDLAGERPGVRRDLARRLCRGRAGPESEAPIATRLVRAASGRADRCVGGSAPRSAQSFV